MKKLTPMEIGERATERLRRRIDTLKDERDDWRYRCTELARTVRLLDRCGFCGASATNGLCEGHEDLRNRERP